MNMRQLPSLAEKKASEAENLRAFTGTKLLFIREKIEKILSLIGQNGIFDQYTCHDISHIDEMLNSIEWIIPKETQEIMTQAEWLMLVLAIYFHDMGMLVTKQEYDGRNSNPEFTDFKNEVETGSLEEEYKEKVASLGEEADRFLYQEYVRGVHAKRIRQWISGNLNLNNQSCQPIINEINDMLGHIDSQFRRDLGIVCESHHLDDLDNYDKYKTNAHYGNSKQEVVNLQYIAIILRTADLLHITSDRTPSIQYRLINPTDPKSIIEWKKQMAVKSVNAKEPRDENGNVDKTLPKDTIEISAYFDKPDQADAFFGLSAYIMYIRQELRKCYDWVQTSVRKEGTDAYVYPWRKVDDEKIETYGFEPRKLQFTVDQDSILKMLVGHTLYNDSSVVIRELIQNGIDAVKLQYCIDNDTDEIDDYIPSGEVCAKWDEGAHTLVVSDNGTGMTINEVENFLLKVGVSKYKSEEFTKSYPKFTPISRFGIGMLTCFLIADDIDIVTSSTEEEDKANVVSLRKVNGKYLLKKVNKSTLNEFIRKHGTEITLHVRKDVDAKNILNDARKWIVFPRCKVTIDTGGGPSEIGYRSPKEALTQYLIANQYTTDDGKQKIIEKQENGVRFAYAVYRTYSNEWEFMTYGSSFFEKSDIFSPVGVCIEGIRVEFTSPGFEGRNVIAVADTHNCSFVLTNVARSAIEENQNKEKFLAAIYSFYVDHIQEQLNELHKNGRSLSWAMEESAYMIAPLGKNSQTRDRVSLRSEAAFNKELDKLKSIIIESNSGRQAISVQEASAIETLYVVENKMIEAAESLLRQIPSDTTLVNLLNSVESEISLTEEMPLLCSYNSQNYLHQRALEDKEVSAIKVQKDQRRIDLRFEKKKDRWITFKAYRNSLDMFEKKIHVPNDDVSIEGITDEFGVYTVDGLYLSPMCQFTKDLRGWLNKLDYKNSDEDALIADALVVLSTDDAILARSGKSGKRKDRNDYFGNILEAHLSPLFPSEILEKLWEKIDKEEYMDKVFAKQYRVYRPKDRPRNRGWGYFEL